MTIRIVTDLFDNVWSDRSEVVVDHCGYHSPGTITVAHMILYSCSNILDSLLVQVSAIVVSFRLPIAWVTDKSRMRQPSS